MWLIAVMFCMTLLQGCVLTYGALQMGRRLRILDFPDQARKQHARVTPRTGGLAICSALVLGACEAAWLGAVGSPLDAAATRCTAYLLLSSILLCGLGLWDDKFGMGALAKFLWQAAAILPFVCFGQSTTTAHLFGWNLDLAWLAIPISLFWLVSCANFVNLVDGLDGLAGSVGLIVSLAVAAMAWWHGVAEVCLLAMMLSGALVGFLLFNWPPARIFLGDSGSLPLGFLVGALALESSAKKAAGLTLAVPVVLLSIPMFDTSMAILRRKLNGRSIGKGDRAHIHHLLRDRGLSSAKALLAICGMCTVTAAAVLAATVLNQDWIAVVVCLALLATLIAGRVFGFNETMLLIEHLRAAGGFVKSVPRLLRVKFVVVRLQGTLAAGRLDLWHKIIKRARRLDALEIDFVCEHQPSGRELAGLAWNAPLHFPADCAADSESELPIWQLNYAARRGNGIQTRISARGLRRASAGLTCLVELSELLVALCDHWPISTVPAADADEQRQAA
jgi:UDP-N-acetylmuramyl pentapeptide phosphotransferase/UDP-N-acetylglucosamine-1-phosphate transferase